MHMYQKDAFYKMILQGLAVLSFNVLFRLKNDVISVSPEISLVSNE